MAYGKSIELFLVNRAADSLVPVPLIVWGKSYTISGIVKTADKNGNPKVAMHIQKVVQRLCGKYNEENIIPLPRHSLNLVVGM